MDKIQLPKMGKKCSSDLEKMNTGKLMNLTVR